MPPERFKSNASHLVPLSDAAIAIIEALPRFTKGDHVFTTTYGEKPVAGFSKAKARMDQLMSEQVLLRGLSTISARTASAPALHRCASRIW